MRGAARAVLILFLALAASGSGCKKRGPRAPDFKLPALEGPDCDLAAERGKVVVLEFWSYRCGWCRKQLKELKSLSEKIDPKKVSILSVHAGGGQRMAPILSRLDKGKNMKVCLDDRTVYKKYTKELPKEYRPRGIPHMLILDKKGYIRQVRRGLTPSKKLMQDIKAWLD